MNTLHLPIPLPETWPRQTKSALVAATSLAHAALTFVRGWCVNSPLDRVRLAAECERLRSEVVLLREELRIKDARMHKLEPARRPQYAPVERLAILSLKAARGWSHTQAARVFFITAATIALWLRRVDECGESALVKTPVPVNKFPEFVTAVAQQLSLTLPLCGRRRIAELLARGGLHLSASTVRRMLHKPPAKPTEPPPAPQKSTDSARSVTAKGPGHAWNIDITNVPTALGLWIPWLPWSFVQRAPFCWHVVIVLDHFSRKVLDFEVFPQEPNSRSICNLLDRTVALTRAPPTYTVTDQGTQFRGEFRDWCASHGVTPRFGAVGKKGSIAVIERFMRTLKHEGTRRILVPYGVENMRDELRCFAMWYNNFRPHQSLRGASPREIHEGSKPANVGARVEPRALYPLARACERVNRLALRVSYLEGKRHLPIVALDRAA